MSGGVSLKSEGDVAGTSQSTSVVGEGLAVLGFLSLVAALLAGHTSPASGYEVSVYLGTPAAFWVAIAVAMVVGISLSLSGRVTRGIRSLGYVLVSGTVVSIAAIPTIRGYHFFGPADSLTHLGWVRDIATGRLDPLEFLYPGVHTSSLMVSELSGLSVTYSIETVVLLFFVVYVVFMPLVVTFMADGWWAIPIGLLSALLFLPVNNVSVFRMAHPTTQAIMLTPFLLYLMFLYLDNSTPYWNERRTGLVKRPSRTGLLLIVAGLSLLYVHPQVAASVLAVLAALSAVQLVARVRWPRSTVANHRLLVGHTVLLGLAFAHWAPRHDRTTHAWGGVVDGIRGLVEGGTEPADGAASRGESLAEIGGGIEVLFAKLFGVSLVFCVVAALLIGIALYRVWRGSPSNDNTFVTYAATGLATMTVVFLLYFFSSVTTQYFRQLGLMMVLVTVLGAAGLARVVGAGGDRTSDRLGAVSNAPSPSRAGLLGVKFLLVVMLIASLATLYRSPYMTQPSDQVPEQHLDGYEIAFERMNEDVPFMGIRSSGGRERDAVYGVQSARASAFENLAVPPPVFNAGNYSDSYDVSRYVVVSERDVTREVEVFGELRYERRGVDRLESHQRVDRVVSNQQVQLYLYEPEDG